MKNENKNFKLQLYIYIYIQNKIKIIIWVWIIHKRRKTPEIRLIDRMWIKLNCFAKANENGLIRRYGSNNRRTISINKTTPLSISMLNNSLFFPFCISFQKERVLTRVAILSPIFWTISISLTLNLISCAIKTNKLQKIKL